MTANDKKLTQGFSLEGKRVSLFTLDRYLRIFLAGSVIPVTPVFSYRELRKYGSEYELSGKNRKLPY